MKQYENLCGPQQKQNMVFNVKKLLKQNAWQILPIAGFHQQTGHRQQLTRAFETACGPPGPEDVHILTENISFGGFSAAPHYQNCSAAVGGFLDSRGLAVVYAGLESTGFRYLACFEGKSPGECLTFIWTPYVRQLLQIGTFKRRNKSARHTTYSTADSKPSLRKINLY
jgi:hypothetical protein